MFLHFRPLVFSRSYSTATTGGFSIPVINFSKFRTASSPKEKQATANEIVTAFKTSGFIYLSDHGIPSGMSTSCSCASTHSAASQCTTHIPEGVARFHGWDPVQVLTVLQSAEFFRMPSDIKVCLFLFPLQLSFLMTVGLAGMGGPSLEPWICDRGQGACHPVGRPLRDRGSPRKSPRLQGKHGDWSGLGLGMEEPVANGAACTGFQTTHARLL